MLNYNIESVQSVLNKKKINLIIRGWAYDTDNKINIKIIDNKSVSYNIKIKYENRNDVYKYFNNESAALNSGFILEVEGINKNIRELKIIFSNEVEKKLGEYIIEENQLLNYDKTDFISRQNWNKFIRSLKEDGIKTTYNKVINKVKSPKEQYNTMNIVEPYIFTDEPFEYLSNNKYNFIVVINATLPYVTNQDYLNTLNNIKIQKYHRIISIINTKNRILEEKNEEIIKLEKTLYTHKEIFKIVKKQKDIKNAYIFLIDAGDLLAISTCKRVQKAIDDSETKILTFNEDRLINNTFVAPLYKQDILLKNRGLATLLRKAIVIHSSLIDSYINDNVDVNQVYIINQVLYHYKVYSEQKQTNKIKPIAFYLPQFHAIPENDEWWGKNFTEWVNVKRGLPSFQGHYQPHVPANLGYYNLVKDKSIQYKQIELAKEFGIYGFCYYYYWFKGKRLLEKPLDTLLTDKNLNFPFCICWANETWSRRWDGAEKEILIKQEHNEETDENFIRDVIPILKDDRYIKVGEAPLLLIYRADLFPNLANTIIRWKEICKDNGIPNLHVSLVQSFGLTDPNIYGGDSAVEFPPHGIATAEISNSIPNLIKNFGGNVYDYRDVVLRCCNKRPDYYTQFRGAMLSWDNTARRMENANIYHYATPEEYKKWLMSIIDYTINFNDDDYQYIFINAWNEWAEGTHLEPDEKYGTQYLEVTKQCLESNY